MKLNYMRSSREAVQPNHNQNLLNSVSQSDPKAQEDFFNFLKSREEIPKKSQSFFSAKGLRQDIIHVTHAEPDICLEVFYALSNTLWPQIQKQPDMPLKDAWMDLIGGPTCKGILCPPEQVISQKSLKDVEQAENQVFQNLDQVMSSIQILKQKMSDYDGDILHKKEILASLDLVQEFYAGFRNKVEELVQLALKNEQDQVLDDLFEPKAVMMGDLFTDHWAYRVPRSKARKLLSIGESDCATKNYSSLNGVAALPEKDEAPEPLVYFKANGNPEKEFVLSSLYRCLNIPVRESALLIFTNVYEANSDYLFAVQASEAVIGEPVLEAFQDPEKIFEEEAYSRQAIGALLTNPAGDTFGNFKYSSMYKTLISIDNSLAFKPELIGGDGKTVNTKSVFHLWPLMDKPVSKEIRTYFTTLDSNLTALAWLQDLSKKNKEYELLWKRLSYHQARKIQVEVELSPARILVSKNLVNTIVDKLQKIERILLNSPSASIQTLFEEVSPLLGRYYKRLRSTFNDPKVALEALWGQKQNGIDYSHLSSLLNDADNQLIEYEDCKEVDPDKLFDDCKNLLARSSSQTPLDSLIRRHREKRRKNLLGLQDVLKELLLLIQKGLTDSRSVRDIVDFMYEISTMIPENDQHHHLVKEINVLLSSLPHEEMQWLLTVERHFARATHDIPAEKRTSSITFSGAFMKRRIFILTEAEKKYLFDQLVNNQKTSNHVTLPDPQPAFYLKQYPERPGCEFASTLFMRLLGITRLPYQDLLMINQYPILLTQKVNGNSVLQVWDDSQVFNNLDPYHTGLLIISALLIKPNEDHFILSENGKYLIPIDNDHYFLPSTFQKNLLFCLDEMKKLIPLEVKQRILSIDFDDFFTSWLRELIKVDDRYNNLVDPEECTALRIQFYEQFIHSIYWKAHKIQYILRKRGETTPLDLLKAVEPSLAKCYLESFKEGSTPRDRFKFIIETSWKENRASILNTQALMEIFTQIGPIDALDLFNELVKENNLPKKEFDDSSLLENTLLETDLGDFFRNPNEILVLRGSKLIKKDKLEALLELRPEKGARIRFMAFPKSPLLASGAIRTLIEGCPNLEYLDVSGCAKLDKIIIEEGEWPLLTRLEAQECPILEKFVCYSHIQVLKIGTSCKVEVSIGKDYPDIVSVTMRTNYKFDFYFEKGQGFEITSVDKKLSNRDLIIFGETMFDDPYFKDLNIKIGEYKISSGKDLGVLISFLDLAAQDITTEKAKRVADLNLTNMERLNLSECVFMEKGVLNSLIQGSWPSLRHLNLSMIELEDEDFSILSLGKWPLLEELHLQRTKLTLIGIEALIDGSNWPQLRHLNLSFNEIRDEGLSRLSRKNWPPLLETVDLGLTRVTTKGLLNFLLNFKGLHLKQVNFAPWEVAHKNFANNLLPMSWPSLEELNLANSRITAFELKAIVSQPKWPRLKHLNLSGNGIMEEGFSSLSLGEWPLLEELHLENTKLTSSGIEAIVMGCNWPQLKFLDISFNEVHDEGLLMLCQENWSPLLETLDLSLIKATRKGLINFFLKRNWPKLKQVIFMSEETASQEVANQLLPSKWNLLEKIDLGGAEVTVGEMEVIVEKSKWPQLKHLDFSNNDNISDDTIEVLSRGNWPLLEVLDLSRTKVTTRGLLNLVLNINWLNLKEIVFALSDNISKTLVKSLIPLNWPFLQKLNLQNMGIRQSDIIAIVNKAKWIQLKYLVLSDNDILDEGLTTLCQGNWPLLETLDLNRTKVTTRGLLNFLVNGYWANLKGIIIDDFEMNESHLVSSLLPRYWPVLEKLDLIGMKMTQEDISVIVKKTNWPRLKYLNLSDNDVSDKGLETLSQGNWPLLEKLHLRNTNITLGGFEIMLKNSNWHNLKELHLDDKFFNDNDKINFLVSEKWPQICLSPL